MASTKISNLTGQTSVGAGDLFVTAQEDATNKKITGAALKTDVLLGNAATSTTAGTVTTAAQGNITSVGTLTGLTMGGELGCADNLVTRPKLKDVAEEVNAIAGTPTAAFNVDLEDGNVQTVTFGAGTYNVGLTNALTSKSASLTLVATNLATSGTKTFLSGAHDGVGNAVKWAGGSAPGFTGAGVDILAFTTVDGGTNWYGFLAGAAMA